MSELVQNSASPDNFYRLFSRLRISGGKWILVQAPALLHMIKMLLAIFLAMGLSMLFNLSKPGTAMITVIIVTQPGSGLVMAKGFYRFVGTFVGVAASLVLAACFSQQPMLFLFAGACWIGLCTAGAITFRNFQSYAFVLAGYTLMIVGLPAALDPANAFDIATTRLSEVTLGLLCAGVVSDVLFPIRLSDMVLTTVNKRFAHFAQFVQCDQGQAHSARSQLDRDSMMLRLIGEVIALENLRTSSTFESATGHVKGDHLRQLNTAFMTVSTTFHSLDQLLLRLRNTGKINTFNAVMMEYDAIVSIMKEDKAEIPAKLQHCRQQLTERLAALRRGLILSFAEMLNLDTTYVNDALLDFDAAAALLQRFTDELRISTRIHNAVINRDNRLPDDISITAHYVNRTDPVMVAMSSLRAMVGFVVSMLFWWQSGWPSGLDAAIFATVVSALFAAFPSPTKTVIGFMQGAFIGGACGFICAYFIQPGAQNFFMLCLSLTPFILVFAWLTTKPQYAGMGMGMLVFFFSYAAVGNVYEFDYVGFLNGMAGGLIGCAIAAAMYMIIDPVDSHWEKTRLIRALRHQVVDGCNNAIPGLLARFESGTRELVGRFAMGHTVPNEDDRGVMGWLLSVFEIGRAIIHLREDIAPKTRSGNNIIAANDQSQQSSDYAYTAIRLSIKTVADFFSAPDTRKLDLALASVLAAIEACRVVSTVEVQALPNYQAVLANLHLIRTSLLEHAVPTAAASAFDPAPAPPFNTSSGINNAA
ncbi:FUSC family protein [Glaciimonas immobilis]|uniref:Putative membrane protein YccC n=1 Tax=Glaciimonas immobilis TaxID=728004 RepID=A0A840RW59_9BURK|nr:FUSC family protein [Glaciimonas immobilis]KAF3997601.1 FUSC family protein [Glaciimonas immobilis]MBB5200700.1 putative membrane protein YccC [Glaciimonas immobilis]